MQDKVIGIMVRVQAENIDTEDLKTVMFVDGALAYGVASIKKHSISLLSRLITNEEGLRYIPLFLFKHKTYKWRTTTNYWIFSIE